jgi:folate-dependent phosphoribosylglycinamide formyltransferase PurN
LEEVLRRYGDQVSAILQITGDYKGRTGLRSLLAVGRETATPYMAYKITSTLAFALAQRIYPNAEFSVKRQAQRTGIPFHSFVAVNSDAARSLVDSLRPDLLISVSCPQYIGRKMLSSFRLGGINIHSSLLPMYAGLAPYFWVLSQGERITGTTVHYLTPRFDRGDILVQRQLSIEPGESALHLFKRLSVLGGYCLLEAVTSALNGSPGIKQDLTRYSYFSHPNPSAYQALLGHGHVLMRLRELRDVISEELNRATRDHLPETS